MGSILEEWASEDLTEKMELLGQSRGVTRQGVFTDSTEQPAGSGPGEAGMPGRVGSAGCLLCVPCLPQIQPKYALPCGG